MHVKNEMAPLYTGRSDQLNLTESDCALTPVFAAQKVHATFPVLHTADEMTIYSTSLFQTTKLCQYDVTIRCMYVEALLEPIC